MCASRAAGSISQAGSGMKAYFGSQGTAYQDSDPTGAVFTSPPVGPYTAGSPLPNLPLTPAPLVYPGGYGIPFAGGGQFSSFNDNLGAGVSTIAQSLIDDSFNPGGTLTQDATVVFPFWVLAQQPSAPAYAFEQINFVDDYFVTNSLGGSTPNFPLNVFGTVVGGAGAYAQVDVLMDYTWCDVNADGTLNGTPVSLGTLTYQFLQLGGGTFSTTITSVGSLAPSPSAAGVLEITGYAWVAGDPSEINVSLTPEPASLGLLMTVGMFLRRRRRAAR